MSFSFHEQGQESETDGVRDLSPALMGMDREEVKNTRASASH